VCCAWQAEGLASSSASEFHRAIAKVDDCLSLVVQDCDAADKLRVMSEFFGFSEPRESTSVVFSALTLLVGRQEGHPACKN